MSTMLESQFVAWRVSAKPRRRVPLLELVRAAVIAAAVAAAVLYLATMSQTPALVSGLIREASAPHGSQAESEAQRPSPVVVTLRPSANDGRLLGP